MKRMIAGLMMLAAPVAAEEAVTTSYEGSFEDATFAVESAIVNQGLVIDYVSHVGDMLNRTGADVGSDIEIFKAADIFIFCSAVVSREVMEADPMNIAHCPYGIFVAEDADGVMIGRSTYPVGPMEAVADLLDTIIADAAGQ
ncbi:DUF302 domain-containing protein [Marinibacterium profundimaris]|uniref:DUF302 domain-containing protein n=1 Tax=Marinibacterium profundimaris TaxID=1679460 RepID=A0A225NNW3_9RHOB|nr:DUF302 domain-containing protein [Marinibacterium profundimaris]OWU72839.1 hypothetical protein ATO3_14135 [Marinibacterium profundimaris]